MNFDDYKNRLPYPQKKDFKTRYFYKAGQVVAIIKPGDHEPIQCLNGCVTESISDEEGYSIALSEYNKHERALSEQFVVDILHDHGLPDNEFTRKLYAIAYAEGHASGYFNIYSCFEDLADLHDIAKRVYAK